MSNGTQTQTELQNKVTKIQDDFFAKATLVRDPTNPRQVIEAIDQLLDEVDAGTITVADTDVDLLGIIQNWLTTKRLHA